MGLMEDIEEEIVKTKVPKWRKLKETTGEEIRKMIDNNMPIEKQIELILKHKIVEKLDRKEYTNIIKKHFGYKGRNKKQVQKIETKTIYKKEDINKKTIEEKLSEDVDLMSIHLDKKNKDK